MPVDLISPAIRDQRRPSRRNPEDVGGHPGDAGHVREIELKRSRGEVSCAECRRLKIKCDKQLPCSSCLRRGCSSLCPNGSLATGQGTRFVLAATDHLHRRMAKMSERIRQLEDALAVLQTRCSDEPHPLLRDELKVRKTEESAADGEPNAQDSPDVIDAFGTLSISDRGMSRFFGAAGGTESLLLHDDDGASHYNSPSSTNGASASPESLRESLSPPLPPQITRFSQAFPFTPMEPLHDVQALIEGHLPPWGRAWALCETYLEQAAWLFRAVSRPQLMDEMLPILYKRRAPLDASHEYSGPHDLALLFVVLAVGALVDLTQEPYNAEAEHYYQLGKAAITLQPVLEQPELVTIQALHLMSIYNAMSQTDVAGQDTSMELSWSLIRLCTQLSQIIGLHRDSARWGLDARDVQRRRALFWDLFVADSWQSLSTGRPPSVTLPYVDCQFPQDDEQRLNINGDKEHSFGSWGFRFACECVGQVAAKTLTAQVPSYATILDLDRTVREFPVPEIPAGMLMDNTKPSAVMSRYVLSHTREVILLCIHRSFFAQAMIDDPVNPLRSQYAPSFLAAYRSAAHILKSIKEQFEVMPELCARFWSPWTYAFSSAVVFGTVVTRGPGSNMAPSALTELDQACELFSKAATHSRRAAKALAILQKLQAKAHHAYTTFVNAKDSPAPNDCVLKVPDEEGEDELAIFGGRTRLISPKRATPSPSVTTLSPAPSDLSPPAENPRNPDPIPPAAAQYVPEPAVASWPQSTHHDVQLSARDSAFEQYMQAQTYPDPAVRLEWTPPHAVAEQPQPYSMHASYRRPEPSVDHHAMPAHYPQQQQQFQMFTHTAAPSFPGMEVPYAPAPRELAEMGLAPQDSALNQRWTSFMQDSGVFYRNQM